jgi:hypothetical protein
VPHDIPFGFERVVSLKRAWPSSALVLMGGAVVPPDEPVVVPLVDVPVVDVPLVDVPEVFVDIDDDPPPLPPQAMRIPLSPVRATAISHLRRSMWGFLTAGFVTAGSFTAVIVSAGWG